MKWISVKDRLPEKLCNYLVCCFETEYPTHNNHICLSTWTRSYGFLGADDYTITHWMPLPEPPEEDKA
jgi:hypothetical protein